MNKEIKGLIILAIFGGLLWLAILATKMGNPYPKDENRFVVFEKGGEGPVDSIHYFKDTMIIYRSSFLNIDDTLRIRMSLTPSHYTIKAPRYVFKVYDTLYESGIKIENHKGDIITGKAVKNVYNNQ